MGDDRVPKLFLESPSLLRRGAAAGAGPSASRSFEAHPLPTAGALWASSAPAAPACSAFVSNLACKCGARGVDGACVAPGASSPPFVAAAPAQAGLEELWKAQRPQPLGATELLLMARGGPQY